jgi:preprotein translocase subunit SecG
MAFLLYTVHIIVCIFLILVVLLQQGKGADLSVFGGGATMTAFGARGAATVLHKMTVWGFIFFIVTTLAIGVLQGNHGRSTVMSDVPAGEATASEAATTTPAVGDATESALPADDGATTGEGEATESEAADSGEAEAGAEPVEAPGQN